MYTPKVISKVVENDLCIGCGLCTYACGSNALSMDWNEEGFLIPKLAASCNDDSMCIKVCPFNPTPDSAVKDETALSNIFLSEDTETLKQLGRVINIYAGYSDEFRSSSSSGGLATYIFRELLEKGIVDHIFTVQSSNSRDAHYEYNIISSEADIIKSSKTKYYPVTLANVFSEIDKIEGKIAVVGVACFVKAIRLAQYEKPDLQDKIPFIIGIICGGVKSKFFTEYLASKSGAQPDNIKEPQYRVKDLSSTANDYSFSCTDINTNASKKIKMREVGDMWGTGLFKANACDFCEDVVTELADISLGDAWLEPYRLDGRGTSLAITRSPLAEKIVTDGILSSQLVLENISADTMRESQQGSYNHRHDGLYVRKKEAKVRGIPLSEKRYGRNLVPLNIVLVQILRRISRKRSLQVWRKNNSSVYFDKNMKNTLRALRYATKLTHFRRKVRRKITRILK